jgi:hypothetical protein
MWLNWPLSYWLCLWLRGRRMTERLFTRRSAQVATVLIKGTKLELDRVVGHLTKGESGSKPPHNKAIAGLNDEQAKAIAEYIKTLK